MSANIAILLQSLDILWAAKGKECKSNKSQHPLAYPQLELLELFFDSQKPICTIKLSYKKHDKTVSKIVVSNNIDIKQQFSIEQGNLIEFFEYALVIINTYKGCEQVTLF